ncbi:MAG: carbamoyl phosphate synthase small subunit, partial [Eubacteriales bacterium]|nr:carbamoyl phosphate synthase small subunit [Eubacteriales bacterium]
SETLDVFLKKAGVPGICGVDTRAITRIIREYGVMNAAIVDDASQADLEHLKAIQVKNAVASVSCKQAYHSPATGEARFTVALLDFGAKANIVRELNRRGCNVHVLPYDTTAEEVLSLKPDGLMLSNGPGDPAENTQVIQEIKKLLGKVPMFGICLGHQLLALANGASTYKLKYGHRGANQPVKDLTTGRVYITSQNHGYAVDGSTLAASGGQVRFINANDHTCEGIDYPAIHAFSVQYHPEACAGPLDSAYLFDRFISMMEVR